MNQLSVLRLFKGFIGVDSKDYIEDGFKYGLLVPKSAPEEVFKEAVKLYGKDGEKWNQTFHKSWEKVEKAPIEQLVLEQIVHYITTYGFEELGIYDKNSVYIPKEKLEIPELDKDIELIKIRAYSEKEVADKLMDMLKSGIALSNDTLKDIYELSDLIDKNSFDEIKNRQIKIYLYDKYEIMPEDPEEFLKYVIYKVTNKTIKVQDKETIYALNIGSRKQVLSYFDAYLKEDRENKMIKLAQVFQRNKNLFLALKANTLKEYDDYRDYEFKRILKEEYGECVRLNRLINRISKLSKKYHKPLKLNVLDRLTDEDTEVQLNDDLKKSLDKITIFREIRIINGLRYRLKGSNSIVYKIRNGKTFATKNEELKEEERQILLERYRFIYEHLLNRTKALFEGKKVYIPENVEYKAPTSEKQFVSAFPASSSLWINRETDLVFGVHWCNQQIEDNLGNKTDVRVDLDIHLQNLGESYGWNSAYRSEERDVLFSGDMTDAPLPDGASELYYVSRKCNDIFVLSLNNYTDTGIETPFELVVAKAKRDMKAEEMENYVLDPNEIILSVPLKMEANQNLMRLGLVKFMDDEISFIFNSFNTMNRIISENGNEVFENNMNFIESYKETALDLKQLLRDSGGIICDKDEAEIDLSLEAIDKSSFIKMFTQ